MNDSLHILLNSILYIVNSFEEKRVDFHKLFKILYFAEQKHLVRYGDRITHDDFVAMKNGPVPSYSYDLLKAVNKGDNNFISCPKEFKESLSVDNGYFVSAKTVADNEWLSESNVKCLTEAIQENEKLNFFELTEKSHDAAWHEAASDSKEENIANEMSIESIAKAGGGSEELLNYMKMVLENKTVSF